MRDLLLRRVEDERDAATIDRYSDLRKEVDEIPQKISDAEAELDTAQELLDGTQRDLDSAKLALGGDPAKIQQEILNCRDKKRALENQIAADYQSLSDSLQDYIPQILLICAEVSSLSSLLKNSTKRGTS